MIPRFYPIYQVAWETEIHPTGDHCVTYIYLPRIIMPKVTWTKMEWKPYEVKKVKWQCQNLRTHRMRDARDHSTWSPTRRLKSLALKSKHWLLSSFEGKLAKFYIKLKSFELQEKTHRNFVDRAHEYTHTWRKFWSLMSINLPYRSSWLLQYLFSCKYFVQGH